MTKTNDGRLANQLWSYSGVYAYAQHKDYTCSSVPFARFQHYFNVKTGVWWVDHVLVRLPKKVQDAVIALYDRYVHARFGNRVIESGHTDFLLPPSEPSKEHEQKAIKQLESSDASMWFFSGWLFRNPVGEEQYRKEVCSFFTPKDEYAKRISSLIEPLRADGKRIVGVHIRQGDYRTWQGGAHYFEQSEVRSILDSFLETESDSNNVIFVLCSDGDIDTSAFEGLSVVQGLGTEIEDLYTLAATDMIIGSQSTYGAWAAYYGNIPFTVFSRDKINWNRV